MKASDYIVEFLISRHITDVFGYPGGMITHFMDSLDKYQEQIAAHLNCNGGLWLGRNNWISGRGLCYQWTGCNEFAYGYCLRLL